MKQVFLTNDNRVVVEETPAPSCPANGVLVETRFSLISTGTELNVIKRAKKQNLTQTLQARGQLVVKGVRKLLTDGLTKTWRAVEYQSALGEAPGYSLCGLVREVGAQVDDLAVGDWVACAGSGYAAHAEIVAVPKNLAVKIPEGLDPKQAAFATVGAIGLQGVRQAAPQLGELAVVIGLGLIGLLTVQILRASGCRVVGVDPVEARRKLAMDFGAQATLTPEDDAGGAVRALSGGQGADMILICAGTPSDEPLNAAMRLTRKRGRVVIVGNVGMNLKREAFYKNEIDLRIACSYGPGRYDTRYEEQGVDYPFGYVRWTERRNMGAVLDLIADGRLNAEALISSVTPIDQAAEGFGLLVAGRPDVVGVVLDYGEPATDPARKLIRRVDHIGARTIPKSLSRPVHVALVGAGSFGQTVYLPLIDGHPQATLQAVVTARGHNAMRLAKLYNARIATTNLSTVLDDESVDAVIIATRHHQHADMAIEALKAGKHVLLEKPLAITPEQMTRLEAALKQSAALFTVGHNRRYAPSVQALKKSLSDRVGPLVAVYRINAGYIPADHWVHAREIGGGRVIGEVCHFVDLLTYLIGDETLDVTVAGVPHTARGVQRADNLSATLSFADGSVATIVYTSLGPGDLPKERLELFWDGRAAVLDDFRTLSGYGTDSFGDADKQDKGWEEQFARFVEAVRGGQNRLLTADEALATARLTFRIDDLLCARQKGTR